MYLDTEKLAQKILDRSWSAEEVALADLRKMLATATPGHETIDEPEEFRWFVIAEFPTKDLEVTLKALMDEAGDRAGQEKWQHDRIVDLLESGEPQWPAFVTASGIIVDGYHRIAANRTLKNKKMPVVIAVKRQGGDRWDDEWNESFPE